MEHNETKLVLPLSIVGSSDVRRVRRELESLDEFINQATLRTQGKQPPIPKMTKMLDELAERNKLNLLLEEHRTQASEFLRDVLTGPSIHISFASDPSVAFLRNIVSWFRENIAPELLIEIGLQPSIAAGCIVRTPNKVFDLSLRQHFEKNRVLLLQSLEKLL